jgi:hypothetical protein
LKKERKGIKNKKNLRDRESRGQIMATIKLHANKINRMSSLINDVKKSVSDYKSELSSLKTKTLKINSSVCNVDDVISSIQASTQTQDQTITSLENLQKNSEQFISDVVQTDNKVADLINQRKKDFYKEYSYLKPEYEKGRWEKIKDKCKKIGQWCRDNWKLVGKIILVAVIIGIAVVTGSWAVILAGALKGALVGGLIGGFTSWISGGSILQGILAGAFKGALTGGLFGALGALGNFLGSSCEVLKALGGAKELMPLIAKVSSTISLSMAGFDLLSLGAGILFGQDNFLTSFNQKLHSSNFYNMFQFGVSALAVFSSGFAKGMENPLCFVEGTLILTAAGLVTIESIERGNKVTSTNENTFEVAEKRVVETYIRETKKLLQLIINGELIRTTLEHPFYVKARGFVSARELNIGDELYDAKGNVLAVEDSRLEVLEEAVKVFNFQVEDFHTYHVGVNGVLVHNTCKGANTGKLIGSIDGLTDAEKKVVNDLLEQGKNVEIIPKDPNSLVKTPDFKIDGIKTELKSLVNPNTNTGMKRIQEAFKQGAENVIIDGREAGLTIEQAQEILSRASGKYPNGAFPGQVEIWTPWGVVKN